MSDAEKSRAFDRFWRGQGLTGRSGSGLGLAIVKQLVTDDGGTVTLRDAPGGPGCWGRSRGAAQTERPERSSPDRSSPDRGGLCVRISLRPASPRSGG